MYKCNRVHIYINMFVRAVCQVLISYVLVKFDAYSQGFSDASWFFIFYDDMQNSARNSVSCVKTARN